MKLYLTLENDRPLRANTLLADIRQVASRMTASFNETDYATLIDWLDGIPYAKIAVIDDDDLLVHTYGDGD